MGAAPFMSDDRYFSSRFVPDQNREILWKALCDFHFNRLVKPDDHVLELAPGTVISSTTFGRPGAQP